MSTRGRPRERSTDSSSRTFMGAWILANGLVAGLVRGRDVLGRGVAVAIVQPEVLFGRDADQALEHGVDRGRDRLGRLARQIARMEDVVEGHAPAPWPVHVAGAEHGRS